MSDTMIDDDFSEVSDAEWESEPVQVGVDFNQNGDIVVAEVQAKAKRAKKSKALVLKQFTKVEAEQKTQEVIATGRALRSGMLELFERGAYKALGYDDFPSYAQDRLGINLQERQLRSTLQAARVDRAVEAEKPLPFAITTALGALSDDPEKVKQAYGEFQEWQSSETRTPKEQITGLKRIVRQLLPEEKKAKQEGKKIIDAKFEPEQTEDGQDYLPVVDLHDGETTLADRIAGEKFFNNEQVWEPEYQEAAFILDTVKGWLYEGPSAINADLRQEYGEKLIALAQWVLTAEA